MKYALAVLLVILMAGGLCAQAIECTLSADKPSLKKGETITMTALFSNPKKVVTAQGTFIYWNVPEAGEEPIVHTGQTNEVTTTVGQPFKLKTWQVGIPAIFNLVAGSAQVDGAPVTPTLDAGILAFSLDKTLLEGEALALKYSLKAQ